MEILVPLSIPSAATMAPTVGQMGVEMAVAAVAAVGGVAADPEPADLAKTVRPFSRPALMCR